MSRDSRRRRFVLGVFLATAACGAALGVLRGPLLVVEDVAQARVLHRESVRAGDTFTLAYIHSSEQIPVRGVLRIEPDRTLTIAETAFAGFGPGLPALTAGDIWRREGGMIIAGTPSPSLAELTVRIVPMTRHRLITPTGRELDLSTLVAAGGAVKIAVR